MSSNGSNNIEIRITGTLDPSLAASAASAEKAVAGIGAAGAESGKEVAAGAAQASDALDKLQTTAAATGKALQLNLSQGIDKAQGIGTAVNSAEQSMLGMTLAAEDQKGKLTAAFAGGADAAEHFAMGTTRARTEVIVLAHEMVQGRFTRIPGSLMVLAESMGGVSIGAMAMGAAGLAAVGGLVYMAYEALEAEKNLDHLAEGFALTGRAAQMSKEEISYNLDFLTKLPGATREATQGFTEFVAQHANVSAVLANEVGQLLPAFVDLYGKQAPEAAGKLTETLANLTTEGFKKLDQEMLNLTPTQYETILNLIETGHQAEAVSAILKQLSANSGIYIKSLGDQVYDIEVQMKNIKAAMSTTGDDQQQALYLAQLDDLEKKLSAVRKLEAQKGQQEASNQTKAEIDDINKANEGLDKRATILARISKLEQETGNARKRGDTQTADRGDSAIAAEQAKLVAFDKQSTDERYRNALAGENARAQLYKQGSAQQMAILREELATATQFYGAEATQALEIQAKINEAKRSGAAQGAAEAKRAAAQEKQERDKETRETEQEMRKAAQEYVQINNDNLHTNLQISKIELEGKKADLERQVQDHEITARQKLTILEGLARDSAALDIQMLRDEMVTGEEGTIEYARRANQIKVIEAQLQQELSQIRRQAAQEQRTEDRERTQSYRSMIGEITQAEGGLIRNIFQGQQTLGQSLLQLGSNLVEKEIEQDAEYYTAKLLYSRLGLAADERTAQGGILVHLFGETTKTAGTVAGETARVAAKEAGAAAGAATEVAAGSASILNDAYKSAAGAYSAVVGIPIIGPILAPVAAATAFGAVAAFDTLTAFEVGTNYVPYTMPALVHAGERIIPAADNRALMDAIGGGGGDGGSSSGPSLHYAPVLNNQPNDVREMIRSQGTAFLGEIARLHRNGAFK